MDQPLDGARARTRRAKEHLATLQTEVAKFERRVQRTGSESNDPATGELTIKIGLLEDPPECLAVLVGEVIYNLRAALDYVVYEVAKRDSGKAQDCTQFPIDDTPERFKGHRNTYLKGVCDDHVALFERLQPYAGCEWTPRLRDLSNPDKHRKLTGTVSSSHASIRYIDLRNVPEDEAQINEALGVPAHMKVEGLFNFRVTLLDGFPVVQELQVLQSQVAETVESFQPLFD